MRGRDQSSEGFSSQRVSEVGMGSDSASFSMARSLSVVVEALVRLSARTADSVEVLGRCWIVTAQPR